MTQSTSTIIGAYGFGKQTGIGVTQGTLSYASVLQNGLMFNQSVQTLQPEIGGKFTRRGSYKSTVAGGGAVNFYPRADMIGHHLMALAGNDTATAVPSQTGAYSHVFAPFQPGVGNDLPWYTLQRVVSQLWAEQYQDAKLNSLSFDIQKSATVTSTANWFALNPSEIALPSIGTEVTDSTPFWTTCTAAVSLLDESNSTAYSNAFATSVERVSLQYGNQLSQDEFVIGSMTPTGSTMLQRSAQVSLDFIVKDKKLWEAVYLNGATSGAPSAAIKRGALTLTLTSDQNITATTQPYTLTFTFPGLDLMVVNVPTAGAQVVRGSIQAEMTLGPSGSDEYTITLVNDVAAY